jgi:translation initiation factor IF-2
MSRWVDMTARRTLALTAAGAFAVVAAVLGWRWSQLTTPTAAAHASASPAGLDVTVLEVRALPAAPAVAVAAPAAASGAAAPVAAAPAPIAPTPSQPATANRTLLRSKKPARPVAPARGEPPELKPEPHADPAAGKPAAAEPPKLESNPYLYK